MFSNFTFQDILGTTLAFCLFPLVIVFPGYAFGWIFKLFDFRARLLHVRLAISLLLSIAISPIFYYLAASLFSMNAALIATILIALVFITLIIRERPTLPQSGPWRILFWILLGWLVLSIFCLVDLQWGQRELYFNVVSSDLKTRVSVIDAMTRTGVPPINPSYYPGHYVKLTFLYFFWYILGSIVDIAGGKLVDARTALFASIIWCGIALMALIAFYLRLRDGRNGGKIWRRALIGIASLSITGLDIIPAIALMYFGKNVLGDLEHWNEQVTAWIGSLLWVPHHVASLIALVVGMMLVHSVRDQPRTKKFIALVFSGTAFASAFGLSVWVTLVFVLFWGGWMISLFIQREQRELLLPMTVAGAVGLLLAGPFLLGVVSGGNVGEVGAFPLALTVRSFPFADAVLENSHILWKSLIRLFFLPLNYLVEFGFFALVAVIWLKSHKDNLRKNPYYFAEFLLLAASFFIATFTRSTIIENNDLGWRSWLPGQFILLIWGVDVLEGFARDQRPRLVLSQRTKYNLVVLAMLGVSTTILDISLLRFGHYFTFDSEAGRRMYSARQAYTVISNTTPEDVIVQYNPSDAINRPSGLYGMRQSAISDRTIYGVPLDEYNLMVAAVGEIFNMKNVQSWNPLDTLCDEYSIDVIVIGDRDTLWGSLNLLNQSRVSLYEDDYTAVLFCGSATSLLTP